MQRKYYIDNLRIICILLLFPFHAAMCFNNFGEGFYVWFSGSKALSQIVVGVYPWWMSLLFVLAGMSTMYALKKRTAGQYAKERVFKLLIPLLFGIVLIAAPQAYIADVFNNGYSGNFFEHYAVFFGRLTDLSGNDGAFTPAHLWFILYLFAISMVTLPLTAWYSKREKKMPAGKLPLPVILSFFVLTKASTLILDFGGKSVGGFLVLFLLGFFLISDEQAQEKLEKNAVPLGIAWAALIAVRCTMYGLDLSGDVADVFYLIGYALLEWVGVLAAIGLGRKFLNRNWKFTRYFAPAAFPIYFFHQTVLVFVAFVTAQFTRVVPLAWVIIAVFSFILTVGVYELFRRCPVTRFMFGVRKPQKEQK